MHKIYDPEFYKVVFFSSAPIGVPFLEKLHEDKRFEVTGVVTMPDAPAGRGMKMQENVIKAKANQLQVQSTKAQVQKSRSLQGTKQSSIIENKKYNFILLHWLTGRPENDFLPRLQKELEKQWHSVLVPPLPKPDDLAINEKVDFVLKNYHFDEHTILVWHSLGSLVGMKVIERLSSPIAGFVSVGGVYDRRITPERKKARPGKYDDYDTYKKLYWPITWNKKMLQENCESFVVISDPNDSAVPSHHQQSISTLLHVPLITKSPQEEHFCGDQEPVILEAINTLLQKLTTSSQKPAAAIHDGTFIQTPNSLRLDSKKYADEAKVFQQRLADKKPDFLVVIAYGKIIPQHILDIPTFWPINVHGSILPKYRGASPIQSVFLHDEKETGITIMKMDAGLDTGDMIDTAKFPIKFNRTAKDIIGKMQEVGPQFLADTLRKYGKWLLGNVKQDDNQATHCGKIEKEDGLIDPYTDSMETIYQKYRAYILWPKIYFMYGDKRVIIEELVLDEKLFVTNKDKPLVNASSQKPEANSCVKHLTVKPEWSKSQSRDDFVKGYGK